MLRVGCFFIFEILELLFGSPVSFGFNGQTAIGDTGSFQSFDMVGNIDFVLEYGLFSSFVY